MLNILCCTCIAGNKNKTIKAKKRKAENQEGPDNHVKTIISLSDQRSRGKNIRGKEIENRPEYVFTNYQHMAICANTAHTQTHTHTHTHPNTYTYMSVRVTRDPLLYTTVVSICKTQTLKTRSKFQMGFTLLNSLYL